MLARQARLRLKRCNRRARLCLERRERHVGRSEAILDCAEPVVNTGVNLRNHAGSGRELPSELLLEIRGVTLDDARRVARRLLGGPEMLTVIVGAADDPDPDPGPAPPPSSSGSVNVSPSLTVPSPSRSCPPPLARAIAVMFIWLVPLTW